MAEAAPSSSVEIALAVLDERWREALPDAGAMARRAAAAALAAVPLPPGPAELSLALVDDACIRGLNHDYRGRDTATNVLAFAEETVLDGGIGFPRFLGDVAVAFETTAAEAEAQAKTLADHLSHLVVHGVLHLLGYDHTAAEAAEEMEGLEQEILARLGIADPYVTGAESLLAGEAR